MNLSRPATVFASAVILASGAAVAVNAATGTDPVTLCSNAKSGAVTVPGSNGSCAKGTTSFAVASDAAVQALGVRVGAAEAEVTRQAAALEALDRDFRNFTPSTLALERIDVITEHVYWSVRVVGVGLKPGAEVRLHLKRGPEPASSTVRTVVGGDGTVGVATTMSCDDRIVYFTSETDGGDPIGTSVIPEGPGC